jgi:LPS sulfotransferase NodH
MSRNNLIRTWRGEWKRLRHRALLRIAWHLRRHDSFQPMFVLATGRSGSTLLTDYLRHVDGVDCAGEVLHPSLPTGLRPSEATPAAGLAHIKRSLQALSAGVRGCKLMLYQLEACGLSVNDVRAAFPLSKYVIIYRESLVEQYLSSRAAELTGEWKVRQGRTPRQARVTVEPDGLRAFARAMRRHYDELFRLSWLRDCSAVMSYEELAADPSGCFAQRICPLLGLPAIEPKSQMVKQNTRPLADRIENFGEVEALLRDAEFFQRHAWPIGGGGKSRVAA